MTRRQPDDFAAFRRSASAVLTRDFKIAPTAIAERIWTRLYIRALAPAAAAREAATAYQNALPHAQRARLGMIQDGKTPTPRAIKRAVKHARRPR